MIDDPFHFAGMGELEVAKADHFDPVDWTRGPNSLLDRCRAGTGVLWHYNPTTGPLETSIMREYELVTGDEPVQSPLDLIERVVVGVELEGSASAP